MYFIIGRFEALKVAVGGEQVCVGEHVCVEGQVCVCVCGRRDAPRRPPPSPPSWVCVAIVS